MQGFVRGADRQQTTLLPECLDDWESNSIRAVDVFVDALELRDLGFDAVDPAATGRPAYHPSPMLKLYIYGYLNRVQSSRRLEREAGRNLEVMWLTGRLAPDHKTIADFRKDNGPAIKKVCAQFVELCRKMGSGADFLAHHHLWKLTDFYFVQAEDPEIAVQRIVELVKNSDPQALRLRSYSRHSGSLPNE
jgi:transposase